MTAFGQTFIEASNAAIVAYTMPPFTVILAIMCLCEQLEKSMILALLIGMFGLGFLVAEDLDLLIKNPTGSIIMLFPALCWAIGNVGMKSRTWTLKPPPLTTCFSHFPVLRHGQWF